MNKSISTWLKAANKTISVWCEFSKSRISKKEELNAIITLLSLNIPSDIEQMKNVFRDEALLSDIAFELSDAIDRPIKTYLSQEITCLFGMVERVGLSDPVRRAYFHKYADNDNEVNTLNASLSELFSLLMASLLNLRYITDAVNFFHRQPEQKYSSSLMDLFYNDCKVIDTFIKRTANVKGIKVVDEIIALRELKKIKPSNEVSNKLLREILSEVASVTAQSAFDSAFCLGDGKTRTKRRNAIDEAKKAYSKL